MPPPGKIPLDNVDRHPYKIRTPPEPMHLFGTAADTGIAQDALLRIPGRKRADSGPQNSYLTRTGLLPSNGRVWMIPHWTAVVGASLAAIFGVATSESVAAEAEARFGQMEVLVVPEDPETAADLVAALNEIRKQKNLSPTDRIAAVDELFSLNRELLFRRVEPRSPEQTAASLQSAAAVSKAQADTLAAARDGSPEAEDAVLEADIRTGFLETLAAGRTPTERIGLVDAWLAANREILAEAGLFRIPSSPGSRRSPTPAALPEPTTPEAALAAQLREVRLSAASPAERIEAVERFFAAHHEQLKELGLLPHSFRKEAIELETRQ
jgi:hypothetical protein